jgi:hypothetical protein
LAPPANNPLLRTLQKRRAAERKRYMTNDPLIPEILSRQFVGRQVSSVTFMPADDVQLRFDGRPYINIFNPFNIANRQVTTASDQPGFRDALCELIGEKVARVSFANQTFLRITFESGVELTISLRPGDYVGPEAVTASDFDGEELGTIVI